MKRLVWPVLAFSWAACGPPDRPDGYEPVNLFEEGAGERVFDDLAFDTLWTYGKGDTVLGSATRIEAFPGGDAVVLDALDQRVHRIGSGGVVWSWGRRGEGPREVENVRAMTVSPQGEVVLADSGNRRLVWLSGEGRWLRAVSLPQPAGEWVTGTVNSIVAQDGSSYILNTMDDVRLLRVSETGASEGPVSVPWTGFRNMDPLQTYGELASGPDGRWVFGFGVGNGFFIFSGADPQGSYPYIEHVDFPPLVRSSTPGGFSVSYPERPTRSAQDMAIGGDTLLVLARNWGLDRYSLNTGEYVESTAFPGPVRRFAFAGDTLLVIDAVGLFPAITALRARKEATPCDGSCAALH